MWRRMLTRLQPEQHRLAVIFIHKKTLHIIAAFPLAETYPFLFSFQSLYSCVPFFCGHPLKRAGQNNMQKQRILFLTSL